MIKKNEDTKIEDKKKTKKLKYQQAWLKLTKEHRFEIIKEIRTEIRKEEINKLRKLRGLSKTKNINIKKELEETKNINIKKELEEVKKQRDDLARKLKNNIKTLKSAIEMLCNEIEEDICFM